ncbi:pyrimidine dimer DNA glycosylase/endonuclease V [Agrococcus sp. Marseille-P2731]|uniref:pyrimidine dimer DNA glycosylase/endonuclease V n=1 Tax=Agrococcus sp. Marseille-P2731 TaxID=1841862 RepID=UPI0009309A92|nr:pyrimidine dimer DNA glycosylase/endonuclease V [Agrococcus sp. Marseille-P2731]
MRLWSLHPEMLDRQGLTAAWREALLAQAVLAGRTRGYTRHPQLERFREQADPVRAIGAYLEVIADAAAARGYRFDRERIDSAGRAALGAVQRIPVTDGQLSFELAHLRAKLAVRSPDATVPLEPVVHPLFVVERGPLASWERP